ncbi:predicted protein [Nematostella vectensis]|uniref:CCHC-type domain-containing protein n=1 Tax=Nematostella vectensis TaxID=45351 RepID=A7T2I7_NEMVE|nr:predicted protein [Nematostella vectensis]|eukprot:XP_001621926.1 hypothetical protein NEMVEDRAFT_v1g221398 [Nematostella vectensis]
MECSLDRRVDSADRTQGIRNAEIVWTYPHGSMKACAAHNKVCHNCGKKRHFKEVCQSEPKPKQHAQARKPVKTLEDYSDRDDENTFTLIKGTKARHPFFKIKIQDTWMELMADPVSSINLLDENDYKRPKGRPKHEGTAARVYPYKYKIPWKCQERLKRS